MSELEGTADHVVVVGRGRVIADASVGELLARVADGRVRVRTSASGQAVALLRHAGALVTPAESGLLSVKGLAAEQIVTILGAGGVPFSEISGHRATLEDAYMELTRDAVEYAGGEVR